MQDSRRADSAALMALLTSGTGVPSPAPGNDLQALLSGASASPRSATSPAPMPSFGRSGSAGVADLLSAVLGPAAAPMVAPRRSGSQQGDALLALLSGGPGGASSGPGHAAEAQARPEVVEVASNQAPDGKGPAIDPVPTRPAPDVGARNVTTSLFTYVDPFLEAQMSEQSEQQAGQRRDDSEREVDDAVQEAVEGGELHGDQLNYEGEEVVAADRAPSPAAAPATGTATGEEPASDRGEQNSPETPLGVSSSHSGSQLPISRAESEVPRISLTPDAEARLGQSPSLAAAVIGEHRHSPSFPSSPRTPTPTGGLGSAATKFRTAVATSAKAADHRRPSPSGDGVTEGYRLAPDADIVFDLREPNAQGISSVDLGEEKVALMSNDLDFRTGRSISGNAGYIAYAVRGGKVRVIDVESGAREILNGLGSSVLDLALCPTANTLAAVGDSRVLIWDFPPLADASTLAEAAARPSGDVSIPHKVAYEIVGKGDGRFVRATWDRQGELLAVAGSKGEVWLWRRSDLDRHAPSAMDGRRVFSEEDEEDIPGKLAVYESDVVDLAFSHDSTRLATLSSTGTLRLLAASDLSLVAEVDAVPDEFSGSYVEFASRAANEEAVILIAWDMNRGFASFSVNGSRMEELHRFTFRDPDDPESFFNVATFDARSSSLLVGNSLRSSVFALKLSDDGRWNFAKEYCLPNPIVSMVITDKADDESAVGVLAAQTKCISQLTFPGWGESEVFGEAQRQHAPLYPHTEERRTRRRRSRSRSRSRARPSPSPVRTAQTEPKLETMEGDEVDETIISTDAIMTTEVAEAIIEAEHESPQEVEHGTKTELAGEVLQVSPAVVGLLEDALARSAPSPGLEGRPIASPTPTSSQPRSDAVGGDLHRLEENLVRKFSHFLRAEQERYQSLMEKERLRYRAEEIERHEQVLKTVAATLTTTVSRQLDAIVARELGSKAIPAIQTVLGQVLRDTVEPKIAAAVDRHVIAAVEAATSNPAVIKAVSDNVVSTFSKTLKSAIADTLVPSMQKVLTATLGQVNAVIKSGVSEMAEASISAISSSAKSAAAAAGELQSQVHVLANLLSATPAAQGLPEEAGPSAPEENAPPVTATGSVADKVELALRSGDLDGAFTIALAAQDAEAVGLLLHKVPQGTLASNLLSQPVVLSLLQFLSRSNLLEDTDLKVAFLQGAMAVSSICLDRGPGLNLRLL
ncbi:hypothetical protein DFJ74DRAFT_696263 [Hyaloraphidium curvatum]|nr:hypothetical protein DFJ74DRAFT_696263 [Hyaloraphidium curvatum]